jgi:hypothetical protein
MERFNLKKLNEVEGKEQYCVEISNRFAALENLDTEVDVFFFFNSHSGGWSPNWVHSTRWLFTGLLYLPRVIVRMENLVE